MQKISKDEILVLIKLRHPDPSTDMQGFLGSLPDKTLIELANRFENNQCFHLLSYDAKIDIFNAILFAYYEKQLNQQQMHH